jgi:carbamoylphosphate synthase large subunit
MNAVFDPVADLGRARAALAAAGIPQPPWRECAAPEEATAAAAELGLPVLVRSLGDELRRTVEDLDSVAGVAAEAIAASGRPACLVERKRGGGCARERRADVDAALGCAVEAKVVAGEVVGLVRI